MDTQRKNCSAIAQDFLVNLELVTYNIFETANPHIDSGSELFIIRRLADWYRLRIRHIPAI